MSILLVKPLREYIFRLENFVRLPWLDVGKWG